MSDDQQINLETEGAGAISFSEMLERIASRPDSDCKCAYDFFDERQDGETTAIVAKFAAMGWTTKQIYEHYKKFMPAQAINWPAKMHEMIALEIEWAVRCASNIK